MKNFIKWLLAAVVALVVPVVLWNVVFLAFIDSQGKLLAFILAPVFALASTSILLGFSDAKDPVISKGTINPFWAYAGSALVIELLIVLLSNT